MIWNSYGFFGAGGLTNRLSDDIMLAKTAAPPHISDTFTDTLGAILYFTDTLGAILYFTDTLGHTHSIVNNSLSIPYTHNNFSLYIHLSHMFFITFNITLIITQKTIDCLQTPADYTLHILILGFFESLFHSVPSYSDPSLY